MKQEMLGYDAKLQLIALQGKYVNLAIKKPAKRDVGTTVTYKKLQPATEEKPDQKL